MNTVFPYQTSHLTHPSTSPTLSMNKAPALYNLNQLRAAITGKAPATQIGKKWVPARPLGLFSLRNRLRLAWGVFTGKYDALQWPENQ